MVGLGAAAVRAALVTSAVQSAKGEERSFMVTEGGVELCCVYGRFCNCCECLE